MPYWIQDSRGSHELHELCGCYALCHLFILWALGRRMSHHSNGEGNVWWLQHLQFQLEVPSKFLLEATVTSVPATCSSITCKLEHKEESETEKENREEIKGKKKGKSIEKDDYINEEPQRIVIKEMMKKHMHPLFSQALYGKIIQRKSQVRDANFIWDPGKLNQDQFFLMDLVFLKTS